MTQIAGDMMLVKPLVIDLGWGTLKTALVNLKDAGFVAPQEAAARRQALVNQYVAAFRHVEANALDQARTTLKGLATNVAQWVVPDQQAAVTKLGGRPARQAGLSGPIRAAASSREPPIQRSHAAPRHRQNSRGARLVRDRLTCDRTPRA